MYNVTKDFFLIIAVYHLSIYQRIPIKKSIKVSTQILSSTTVFHIDNNAKVFLSRKSAY